MDFEREQKFYDLYKDEIQYELNRISHETYYNPYSFNELYQKKNIEISYLNVFLDMYNYYYDSLDDESEDECDLSDNDDIVVTSGIVIDLSNNNK